MSGFSAKKFRSPDAEFYPGYFWVLNAPMTEENLLSMLRDMNSHGAKSICIHPSPASWNKNSNAEPDYLTPEYLELMDKLHAEAEKLGMHSYYYDEGGFPSGTSVGMVVESDPEKFYRQFMKEDEQTGKFELVKEYNSDFAYFYPPKGYPNLLEKGVGERFIELAHEKLKKSLGKYFGKTILYTFDDEPALPGYMKKQMLGWCSDFGEEFFKRKGYRIEPFAAEVAKYSPRENDDVRQHRIDYCDVRSQLFTERFLIPLRDWARANGLGSGGHFGGEHLIQGNLHFCYGHIMRALRAMDLPGVDIIWRQIFPETLPKRKKVVVHPQDFDEISTAAKDLPFTKYASSVAHQAGHCNVLTEDFAAYGAGLTPQVMKFVIDHQLVRGATHFVFSNIPHDYSGRLINAGCRPKFGKYHPFWDWFDLIHLYIARISSLLSMGRPAVDTLVYFDARSIWCDGKTMQNAAAEHYRSAAELLKRQIDFDYADDDALIDGKIVGSKLKVGQMSYSTLVIPPTGWMDPKAAAKVEKFRKAGGKVLSTTQIPEISPTLQITPATGKLRVTKRHTGGETLYFITSESPRTIKRTLHIPESGSWQLFDPWTGKRFEIKHDDDKLNWEFPPFGSLALVINSAAAADAPYTPFRPGRKKITLNENWTIRKTRECRFDGDTFRIVPVDGVEQKVELGDWSTVFGPWFSGEAVYQVIFDSPSAAPAQLSLGEVNLVCEATLNGKTLGRSFSDPAHFATDGILKKGRNILQVRIVNTAANAIHDPEVIEYWQKNMPPSEYQEMNYAFEKDSFASGLYGPVSIKFAKK